MTAEGEQNKTIAELLGIDARQVARWRQRFVHKRLAGIEKDLARGGRKATKREQMAPVIIERTTQSKPSHATHWSVRTLADTLGIDKSMVQRVWHASGLKPHLAKTFKVSRDKKFVEKVIDVVGLYLNPPEHALVLCADEKTSVQALDRTQPGLPLVKGRLGTMTHDYVGAARYYRETLVNEIEVSIAQVVPRLPASLPFEAVWPGIYDCSTSREFALMEFLATPRHQEYAPYLAAARACYSVALLTRTALFSNGRRRRRI